MMSRSTIVYIDGFNLYYGALRGSRFRWLDLEKYFTLLRPQDDIRTIHYFTAMIHGARRANQQRYLQALETCPRVNIILGKFKRKQVQCSISACSYTGNRIFDMPEEKRTDVNIAVQMLDDAHNNRCAQVVLVSGDSDLVPAINNVKERRPTTRVVVYVPSRNPIRGAAVELRAAADKDRTMPLNLFRHAQFPRRIANGAGGFIEKPQDW